MSSGGAVSGVRAVALYAGAWSQTSQPYVKGQPLAAEFVSLDDHLVQFRVDGQPVRIPRSMLHSFRTQQGQLQFRFTGGMIVAVPAPGKGPVPDSDWAEFPRGKNSLPPAPQSSSPAQQVPVPQTPRS